MVKYSVGLDIGSAKIDACISVIDARQHVTIKGTRQFSNTVAGFKQMDTWIKGKQKVSDIPLVMNMEATGIYHEQCAYFFHDKGYQLSVVLPNKAKRYLQSFGYKSKNDQIDSKGLSRMGAEQNLGCWQPRGRFFYDLRLLTRQLQNLQELKTISENQLHALEFGMYQSRLVVKQHKKLIATYEQQIEILNNAIAQHLESDPVIWKKVQNLLAIKGIGVLTIAVVLAETNGFELFTSSRQLVSFAGYDAVENQSGKHKGKTRISKKGNSRIRRCLHMPAFSVVMHQKGIFKNLFERVFERSGLKMKGYVAVQKNVLVILYSVWKRNERFDSKSSQNNPGDVELVTSSSSPRLKKVVAPKARLHKVVNPVEVSQYDSSPCEQS